MLTYQRALDMERKTMAAVLVRWGKYNAHLKAWIRQVGIHAAWVPIEVLDHGLEVRLAQVLARLQVGEDDEQSA